LGRPATCRTNNGELPGHGDFGDLPSSSHCEVKKFVARNTIRRILRAAEEVEVQRETPWLDEDKLQAIGQRIGRPGLLTTVHELLGQPGGVGSLL
jgi:hypothetical protein